MAGVAPEYGDQPQPFQQPPGGGGGPYSEPPPYYGQRPSAGSYQYPPEASYPPGNYGYPPPGNYGYPPGNYGYPPAPPPPPQQQQQQQSVVIINAGVQQQEVVHYVPFMSFSTHKTIACLTFWFCGIVFGIVAYILAILAESSVDDGDISTARHLGRASLSVSVIGMIVFIIILSTAFGV